MRNIIMNSDSYKATHWLQYPPKTTSVYSYFESRGEEFPFGGGVVAYGFQYFNKEYLIHPVTKENIEEAEYYLPEHFFGNTALFNRKGWEHIINKHGGHLPVSIRTVLEGTVVPQSNIMMSVENTDPECAWLTNYLETLLVNSWYPCTIATVSRYMKKILLASLERTGNPELIDFKLHDFGCRGVSCPEQAGLGGSAHLVNFKGTDNMPALVAANKYYNGGVVGHSIPAGEHSTFCSWGKDREVEAYDNMLNQFPTGLVAVVSDSYDIYNACEKIWGGILREKVLARKGTVVIRPDSGDPKVVVPKILDILGSRFGFTTNLKKFKVLPDQVRVIQGDGIGYDTLEDIVKAIEASGWSMDNVAFGSGGGLLQKVNRDTFKFAFKCAHTVNDRGSVDVFKRPKTADWKKSKKGRMKLILDSTWKDGEIAPRLATVKESNKEPDVMQEVFRNGELLIDQNFKDIRERAAIGEFEVVV